MTQRPAGSYLVRIEHGDEGEARGSVTSVQTGERADFRDLSGLALIIEKWSQVQRVSARTSEASPPEGA